jgi:hypothetical protein
MVVMLNWRLIRAKSKSKSRLIAARPPTGPDSLTFLPGHDDSARFPSNFGDRIGGRLWFVAKPLWEGEATAKSYKSIESGNTDFDRNDICSNGIIQLTLHLSSWLVKLLSEVRFSNCRESYLIGCDIEFFGTKCRWNVESTLACGPQEAIDSIADMIKAWKKTWAKEGGVEY